MKILKFIFIALVLMNVCPLAAQRAENCPMCYGTRNCQTCHGKGYNVYTSGAGPYRINCGACGGNGRCTYCNGSGLNPNQDYNQPIQPNVKTSDEERHEFLSQEGIIYHFITRDHINWKEKHAEAPFDFDCYISGNSYKTYNEDDIFWYAYSDTDFLVAIPKRQKANLFIRSIDDDSWHVWLYIMQPAPYLPVYYQFIEDGTTESYQKLFHGPLWEKRVNHRSSAIYKEVDNDEDNWYIVGEGVRITLEKRGQYAGEVYEFVSKTPQDYRPPVYTEESKPVENKTEAKGPKTSSKSKKLIKSDTSNNEEDEDDIPWYGWIFGAFLLLIIWWLISVIGDWFD